MATRKWNGEFLVNTSTAGIQNNASVAALAGGGFVIAWLDQSATNHVIRFQRFDATGNAVGTQTTVAQGSFYSANSDMAPQVSTTASGGFVISFGDSFNNSDTDPIATFYGASGNQLSDPTTFSIDNGHQRDVHAASLASGRSVVVWNDEAANGGDIMFRFRASNGSPEATTFSANAGSGGQQFQPDVASNPSGDRFAIVWTDMVPDADVKVAVFDGAGSSSGTGVFSATGVSSNTTGAQAEASIAFLDDERFVIAWSSDAPPVALGDNSAAGILFKIMDISGQTLVTERVAPSTVFSDQFSPDVAVLPNGSFVIVWQDDSGLGVDGDTSAIRLQAFDGQGNRVGGEITVNTTTSGLQTSPSVAALKDGRVVVTWQDASGVAGDPDTGIRAQIVDPRNGIVDGTSGADKLYGHDAIGDIISGGAGGDALYGLNGDDSLYGGEGGDTLDGGAGADTMVGGTGTESYIVDNANDTVIETVVGESDFVSCKVSYVLSEGSEIEYLGTISQTATTPINLTGNSLSQTITGNNGANVLDGGEGGALDTLAGRGGNDTLIVRSNNDLIAEGLGEGTADRVKTTVSFTLAADDNIEFLEILTPAGTGAINLTGNGIAQTITGNAGANILSGLAGTDILIGGKGKDTLNGGTQKDIFRLAAGDSGQTATTLDIVQAYQKGAVGTGDVFDYSSVLTRGGSNAAATNTQASVNQVTGVATFAAGSGTTLADALGDITARFTAAVNTKGEFAFFKLSPAGSYHLFISDGVAGVGANDVLVQLAGLTTIGSINLAGGDLTILT